MHTNYNRMPGFGDLPGDRNHPNSPDYIEPDYDDAIEAYANQLIRDGEVTELVEELFHSADLVLAAINHYANGRAPDYNATSLMQRLRRIVQSVEAAA